MKVCQFCGFANSRPADVYCPKCFTKYNALQPTQQPITINVGSFAFKNGKPSSASVRIRYDSLTDAYYITTPFKPQFVATIKTLIPLNDRAWDEKSREWMFKANYLEPMLKLASLLWPNKVFLDSKEATLQREQEQAAKAAVDAAKNTSLLRSSKTDEVITQFIRALPYEATKKAYLHAVLALHPDRMNGMDEAAKQKASDRLALINATWTRIEKDVYGK